MTLARVNAERRYFLRGAGVAAVASLLLAVTVLATLAAQDGRRSEREVRRTTELWNAYQAARFAIAREELALRDYRLVPRPGLEQRFAVAAGALDDALDVVRRSGGLADVETVHTAVALNLVVAGKIAPLVRAVETGDARRAERIDLGEIRPTLRRLEETIAKAAAGHRAESVAGTEAAAHAEVVIVRTAVIASALALLLLTAVIALVRYKNRLDRAHEREIATLARAARTDSLTGLLNHRAFHDQLGAVVTSANEGRPISLVLVDLDGLKDVNDVHGHHAGDEQLRAVAAVLVESAPGHATAYRIGGDEFAVTMPDLSVDQAVQFAEQINARLIARSTARTTRATAGVAGWSGGGKVELIRQADMALIEAKRTNAGALAYTAGLDEAARSRAKADSETYVGPLATALARAVDTKDTYTRSHSETVAELCVLIAHQLGFDEAALRKIRLAGLLHDVGKIGVSDAILRKPGPLTADELAVMKTHSVLGANIVAAAGHHHEALWIRHHHERIDGLGYPDRLLGSGIPAESLVIAVADAFEAMVSERPYRAARTVPEALEELVRCAGTQFDGACVNALVRALGRSNLLGEIADLTRSARAPRAA